MSTRSSHRAATILSQVFHPVLTGAYVLLAAGVAGTGSIIAGLGWSLLAIAMASGIPALGLFLWIRSGTVSGADVALREQRARPLAVTLVCCLLAVVMLFVLGGPRTLPVALIAALASGVVLTLITLRWKISFHSAVLSGGIAILVWAAGPFALLALGLLGAVSWARVVLRRHTVAQVAAGAAVGGAVCAMIVLLADALRI